MKSIILSSITLLVMISAVLVTTLFVSGSLGKIEGELKGFKPDETRLDEAKDFFCRLYSDYQNEEKLLTPIIPQAALAEIKGLFIEAIASAEAGDYAGLLSAKGRLECEIERQKEHSKFSIWNII